MQKSSVHKIHLICFRMLVCGLLVGSLQALTIQLNNGQTATGEPVSPSEKGVLFRQDDGSYSDRVTWDKFSQDDLKKLAAANPKIAAYAAPFIEPPAAPVVEDSKAVAKEKAPIVIKNDYSRLDRPAAQSLFKSLFSTGVTVFALLLIYAANIFAGYEVAIFRAQSPGLVCGISAALPFLGPIIFLCMPTQVEDKTEIVQEPMHEKEAYHVGEPPAESADETHGGVASLQAQEAAALPPTQNFARGQFTFNRRFFETKFPGFFSMIRREADRDMELHFTTARGLFNAHRITRITADEIHLQIQDGHASHETVVPFAEIQAVVLKHKDA